MQQEKKTDTGAQAFPAASQGNGVLQRELTEEERKNPVSSGAVEWHDPLDKPEREEPPTGKLALASVMLGAAGLCVSCAAPAAAALGAAGIVCCILSRAKHEDAGKLRIAGAILSGAALFIGLVLVIWRIVMAIAGKSISDYYQDFENSTGI